jgi:LmbE family N-acetylglucosaminyl deacetylase
VSIIDVDRGTDESQWRDFPMMNSFPPLDLSSWQHRRVVVLAAHPDDEVLAAGGTLALLAERRVHITFVWATRGEASHPNSTAPLAKHLARLRVREAHAALSRLGILGETVWLGFPDSGLKENYVGLVTAVRALHLPGDVWLAPFRDDGHPDHEACGHAAAEVTDDLVELPIWAWHASTPDDNSLPWHRARAVSLPPDVMARKAAAIAEFRTQVRPIGPGAADGPVLPARVLDHFLRDIEVVLA